MSKRLFALYYLDVEGGRRHVHIEAHGVLDFFDRSFMRERFSKLAGLDITKVLNLSEIPLPKGFSGRRCLVYHAYPEVIDLTED